MYASMDVVGASVGVVTVAAASLAVPRVAADGAGAPAVWLDQRTNAVRSVPRATRTCPSRRSTW